MKNFKQLRGFSVQGKKRQINELLTGSSGVQLGGEGGLPCPFLKIEKSALILEKKLLIASIYLLNFQSKIQFLEYLGRKTPKIFPAGLFFLCF